MSTFTAQQPALRAEGPRITLQVTQPQAVIDTMTANGEQIPPPLQLSALVDTGASLSTIQTGSAATLGLQPVGVAAITTANLTTPVEYPLYAVRLIIPNGITMDGIVVVEMPLQGQNIGALIGRDVLALGVLVYIGYANLFTMSF